MTGSHPAPIETPRSTRCCAVRHSHMLPREAYVDEAVLAWEREAPLRRRLGVRRPRRPTSPSRGAGRRAIGDHGRAAHRDRRRARCTPSPTSAATAATSCWPADACDRQGRRAVPVPRVELRARRLGCALAPRFGASTNFEPSDIGAAARARTRSGAAGCSSTSSGGAGRSTSTSARSPTLRRAELGVRPARRRRDAPLRARGELEDRRSRTTTSATTAR